MYTLVNKYFTEITSQCPLCNRSNTFIVRQTIYDMPHEGPTVLASGKCKACGYKVTWIYPYEEGKKLVHRYEIKRKEDLNTIVIIGENTDIEIPELGLKFLSTENEPGYLSTIEGILLRFLEKIEVACDTECEDKRKMINEAINGEKMFTLILLDRHGRSRIFSDKVVVEENND